MSAQQTDRSGGGVLALLVSFVGAAGVAASLTCVYLGMRDVMVSNGGFCAQGGPYQINPGQICDNGDIWLLMGGVFAGLFFAAVLLAGSRWYGVGAAGVGLLIWAALFGALGWNFIQLGFDPPANMSSGVGWIICGIVFWVMALGGLIPGLWLLGQSFKDASSPDAGRSVFSEPLVRADVTLERQASSADGGEDG